ncbi:hypothetical protein GGR56DRAFT_663426 [Xylariaceae sp. FL0804]|nr:hypothetical protein GGR56DRAFT_663426 [Xylariaceae sp. FL0804]
MQLFVHYVITLLLGSASCLDLAPLSELLSPASIVESGLVTTRRWSDFGALTAGGIVHPATAEDAQKTLKWTIDNNKTFLVQNGGNGWATTFHLGENGIVIALDLLRSVTFSANKSLATIGGGSLVSDVASAGQSAGTLVVTGTCNCVGFLGAALGGGIGYLTGEYGLGVDNVISLDVVRADGSFETLTHSSGDLFWAVRGAGPNFALVTSATVRAYPVTDGKLATAWTGALVFDPAQLDEVLEVTASLRLAPPAALSMTWSRSDGIARIIVVVFYHGTEDDGRIAFAPLLALGPVSNTTAIAPYSAWNTGADAACKKGGYKPTWGVGLGKLEPTSWRAVYDVWANLSQQSGAEKSSVLLNVYPMQRSRTLAADSAAYPFRDDINYFASFTSFLTDLSLESTALDHGRRARQLWQATDGLARHSTYINNALGDESLATVYGDHLSLLQELKTKYDPKGLFDQWFPLHPERV